MLHVEQQNQTDKNTKEDKNQFEIINSVSGFNILPACKHTNQLNSSTTKCDDITFKSSRLAISFP